MTDLMEKNYDKEIDIYYNDIASYYHCKYSPCILPLNHHNLQNFLLCNFHDRTAPTATPLASFQNSLQEKHVRNAPDYLQMRHQLFHIKYQNLKPISLQVLQRK